MRKAVYPLFAAVVALSFMGCGDDGAPASTTTLTNAQANELTSLLTQNGNIFESVLGDFSRTDIFAESTGTQSFENSVSCESSGSAKTSGNYSASYSESSASGDVDFTVTYTDCAGSTSTGDDYLVDGSVATDGDFSFGINPFSGSGSMRMVGSLDVSGDNITAGTCGIGVTASFTLSGNQVSINVSGTVCGVSVDYDETEDFS